MLKYKILLLLWFVLVSGAKAQLLRDEPAQQLVRQCIDKIYNFEFAAADPIIKTIRDRYPKHPVAPMLVSLKLYWQGTPLRSDKPVYQEYLRQLKQTLALAKTLLDKNEADPEGIFFALAAHSYLAMQVSEEGHYMEAMLEARKTYDYLKQGMKLKEVYPDFLMSTGLYNYYVVQYPENHPMVKPLMLFFSNGDKALGIGQLSKASQLGMFTKTEALYYLMHIYVKHEMQFAKALNCAAALTGQFPNNLFYALRHAELLVLNGRFDEANPVIGKLLLYPDKIFQSSGLVFKGIIAEKKDGNAETARGYYEKAIGLKAIERRYTSDYYAMAYAGLGRLAAKEGKKELAKAYYKKALDIAEYESIIREAKNYLKNG